jgi:hypothetical protein
MSTLADFHYDIDHVCEHLQTVIDQLNTSANPHSLVPDYFEAQEIYKEALRHHTAYDESRINEQLNFDILDHLVVFRSANVNPDHVNDLATILSIDRGLRTYCEKHVLGDGVFAALEYDIKIESKKDVIKSALELI